MQLTDKTVTSLALYLGFQGKMMGKSFCAINDNVVKCANES